MLSAVGAQGHWRQRDNNMCSHKTLLVALEFELQMNFTCHEIVFVLFIPFPLSQPLKYEKIGCWLDLACGLCLAGSFSIHDFKGCMCVYGKGYREVEGQVTPHKPPLIPTPTPSLLPTS